MTDETLLFRQVNPSWVQKGHVTSQVFKPTPKDDKKLSVYDGDLISAEKSWEHFTDTLGFASIGVMAVTVKECHQLELSVESDPDPFPKHAIINFQDFSDNQISKKAKKLKAAAVSRGWQYQTENNQ